MSPVVACLNPVLGIFMNFGIAQTRLNFMAFLADTAR